MSEQTQRQKQTSETLRQLLMPIFQHKVRNVQLQQVTITAVKISRNLQYAQIYFTLLDPQHDELLVKQVEDLLTRLKGYMRYQVAQQSKLRKIPEFQFRYDKQRVQAQQLAHLIDQAIALEEQGAL